MGLAATEASYYYYIIIITVIIVIIIIYLSRIITLVTCLFNGSKGNIFKIEALVVISSER